ncbi:MAG: CARDB domain-containing protein, partial [Gelidibacter sp.]
VLYPADENDVNTVDGKLYVGSISQLPSGSNWQARVQAQTNGCATEMGPFNEPKVLIASDLEIFANHIVFDNPNPEVSSPLQITATIHNKSDLPADNFVVHLENQFDTTAVYPNITVDHLGPHQSTSVVWNIITPSIPSWNPMEVFVDYTNVIAETNELNNRAIRPFTNGDFNIPGAINVQVSSSPSVVRLPSSTSKISVSGYAYYTDTAVRLQDSTVAGATVSFTNPITGSRVQTHTNSKGYFSFSTPSGSQSGIYSAPIEVTDFTLSAEAPVTWELVQGPCLPDLSARINPSSGSILVGDSFSATLVVKNDGCAPIELETLLEMNQTGGLPLIPNITVPPLAPGASFSYNFTVEFDTVGTYYITGLADAEFIVVESSENNNLGTSTIRVNPRIADITPSGSGRIASRYVCSAINATSFGLKNIGYIGTGTFTNTIDVYYEGNYVRSFTDLTLQDIVPGASSSVSIPFEYTQIGRYSFTLNCDVPDIVLEISETNNTANYYIDILECMPDLYVSASCEGLVVDPIDPKVPGTVTYTAIVGNRGNALAAGPVEFQFTLSNGEVYNLVHEGDILPGQQVTFSTQAPATNSGLGVTLTATVDPNNHKVDTNRNNNSVSDTLCWEFEPVPLCGNDFWDTIYHENESAQLAVGLNVKHLYQASEVKIRFEVAGPGINGWALLGDATVDNVNRCPSCPYRAALPNRFVFNESGIYTFRMTSDPDNEYEECNEDNNVLIKEVTVANQPDMRILSQYINPTLLNPEPGQFIFFDISYENIGYSNIHDRMDLTVLINDTQHAVVPNVPGLIKNHIGTIAVPIPYASEIEGLQVARAIIDSNQNINDRNRRNNEATRSFVVGAAANLSFNTFSASNETADIGETITLDALIANNGELDVDAEVLFSYISVKGDTIAIGTRPVKVLIEDDSQTSLRTSIAQNRAQASSSGHETVSIPWTVMESPVTILGEIINSSELEFDYNDNFASTRLNTYNVSIVGTLACEGQDDDLGTLTVEATNGTAPYAYHWSNGFMGAVLEAKPGTYSVTVIDATGKRAVAAGTIEEDASCIIPVCKLSAVSFDVPTTCDPGTGAYTTTVVVAYENAPTQGFITVNGTNHPITGSPQSFEVDFYSGPVVFNISFTEDNDCNLMIPVGITLAECTQDCEGTYGGFVVPGTTCLDTNGNASIWDENCFCNSDVTTPLANDDLCDAISLTLEASSTGNQYSNAGATVQTDEPMGSCWYDTDNLQTVWFSFVAPNSGNVTLTTDISGGTLRHTQIAIYEAATNCNALATLGNEIYCDEDHNSERVLTGLTAGTIYYVQVAGMNSQTGTFGIEVKEGTLSIDNHEMDYGIHLYPNPTPSSAVFHVATGQFKGHQVKLKITDLLGKTIYSTTTQFEAGKVAIQPTGILESGVYFVHLEQGGRSVNKRLIVK